MENSTITQEEMPVLETLSIEALDEVAGGGVEFYAEVSGNSGTSGVNYKVGIKISR